MIKLEGSQAPFDFGNSWKKGEPLEKVTGYDLDHSKAMTWHHCAYIPTSTSTSHQPDGHLKKLGLSVQSGCLKPLFPINSVLVLDTDSSQQFHERGTVLLFSMDTWRTGSMMAQMFYPRTQVKGSVIFECEDRPNRTCPGIPNKAPAPLGQGWEKKTRWRAVLRFIYNFFRGKHLYHT